MPGSARHNHHNRRLVEILGGSHLYGLAATGSDHDILTVYSAEPQPPEGDGICWNLSAFLLFARRGSTLAADLLWAAFDEKTTDPAWKRLKPHALEILDTAALHAQATAYAKRLLNHSRAVLTDRDAQRHPEFLRQAGKAAGNAYRLALSVLTMRNNATWPANFATSYSAEATAILTAREGDLDAIRHVHAGAIASLDQAGRLGPRPASLMPADRLQRLLADCDVPLNATPRHIARGGPTPLRNPGVLHLPPPPPTAAQLVRRFARELLQAIRRGGRRVSTAELRRRRTACAQCPFLDRARDRCQHPTCGCALGWSPPAGRGLARWLARQWRQLIGGKLTWSTTRCPLRLWGPREPG